MPVASPYPALGLRQSGVGDELPVSPVRFPPIIFAPRRRVLIEKMTAYPMMLTDFGAVQPREVRLRLIDVHPILGRAIAEFW